VEEAVVALVTLKCGVACLGPIASHLELKVQPAGIQLPAREAPMLKIDAEVRKLRH
jgi:hypothetical protein